MSPAIAEHRNYQGFGYYANTGIGVESQHLAQLLVRQYTEAVARAVLLSPKSETLRRLNTVFVECRMENWDGEGAAPISVDAYREASRFISLLPSMNEMPEIVPSPNGQIGLEWYVEKNHLLVVAMAGRQSLTYASLEGTPNAISGVLAFNDSIPGHIIDALSRLNRFKQA